MPDERGTREIIAETTANLVELRERFGDGSIYDDEGIEHVCDRWDMFVALVEDKEEE